MLCPKGFSKVFKYSKQAGIYMFYSILDNQSYIGSTTDLYKRLSNHKIFSVNEMNRHPKFYNYVNKYGWEQFEIRVLALVSNNTLEFKEINPDIILETHMIKILENLTKYESLVIEQFCIDLYKPELNINIIVNIGDYLIRVQQDIHYLKNIKHKDLII
jgi:predicted GIY-YIG superfamily endonuclease